MLLLINGDLSATINESTGTIITSVYVEDGHLYANFEDGVGKLVKDISISNGKLLLEY